MRVSKGPWFRKQNQTWYATLHGEQIPLAEGKKNGTAALQAYRQLMAGKHVDRTPQKLTIGPAGVYSPPTPPGLPALFVAGDRRLQLGRFRTGGGNSE